MTASYIKDGSYCDNKGNKVEWGWDSGDCCECTCEKGGYYGCSSGYDCQDPDAKLIFEATGYTAPSLTKQEMPACRQDIQAEWLLSDTNSATSVGKVTFCSGGNFEVKLTGHVNVTTTIYVLDGASLNITGAPRPSYVVRRISETNIGSDLQAPIRPVWTANPFAVTFNLLPGAQLTALNEMASTITRKTAGKLRTCELTPIGLVDEPKESCTGARSAETCV